MTYCMLLQAKLPVPHVSAVALQEGRKQLLHCNMILKWRRKVKLHAVLPKGQEGKVL